MSVYQVSLFLLQNDVFRIKLHVSYHRAGYDFSGFTAIKLKCHIASLRKWSYVSSLSNFVSIHHIKIKFRDTIYFIMHCLYSKQRIQANHSIKVIPFLTHMPPLK